MGKAKRRRRLMTVSASNMEHMAYRLADQQTRKAIVKEEQEQDVRFDGLIRTGVIVSETIPWHKMPLQLRALPFKDRPEALAKWEQKHGDYMAGKKKACLNIKGVGSGKVGYG